MIKPTYKTITVDLTDAEFLKLAIEAHKQDITFNKLCQNYLEDFIKKCENRKDKK
jgi:hypothetical protein